MCTHILGDVLYNYGLCVGYVLSGPSPCAIKYFLEKKSAFVKLFIFATQFSHEFCKNTPEWKMPRPWTRSMPSPLEENYGTQTSNNFTQGQSSQQGSEAAFSRVCRLFEQSQQ